jgi:ATP-dependent Lon protease
LVKLLFPDGKFTKEDIRKCLEYALVGRRRVKEQLKKIGGMEFYDVHFSYIDLEDNEEHFVGVPESGGKSLIPEGDLPAGTVYAIASNVDSGHKGLFRLDIQKMPGNGKISDTGFGGGTAIKEEMKEAVNYVRSNLNRITQSAKFSDFEFHLKINRFKRHRQHQRLRVSYFPIHSIKHCRKTFIISISHHWFNEYWRCNYWFR